VTPEQEEIFFDALLDGASAVEATIAAGTDKKAIWRRLQKDRQFHSAYYDACKIGVESDLHKAEEMLAKATPYTIHVVRERVNWIKWKVAKRNALYSDKPPAQVDESASKGIKVTVRSVIDEKGDDECLIQ